MLRWDVLTHKSVRLYRFRQRCVMEPFKWLARSTPWYDENLVSQFKRLESDTWKKYMGGASLLEVGCGPGDYGTQAAGKYGARRYLGLDVSFGMLRDAKKRNPAHDFLAGDIAALPFIDRAFDLVFCCHVIHHLPIHRRDAALRELARVSRGVVIVGDVYNFHSGFRKRLYEIYYSLADGSYYRSDLGEWIGWFERNGFRVLEHANCGADNIVHRVGYWVVELFRGSEERSVEDSQNSRRM
jgi:ubiquinone/menaquinone biosynthesis C-methylase UbiE